MANETEEVCRKVLEWLASPVGRQARCCVPPHSCFDLGVGRGSVEASWHRYDRRRRNDPVDLCFVSCASTMASSVWDVDVSRAGEGMCPVTVVCISLAKKPLQEEGFS